MVSENIVNIILKMEDQATQIAQKAEQAISKLGNTAQQSNNKAAQSVEKLNINYGKAANEVSKVVTSAERVGSIGPKQFDRYNESIQKSIVNFNRLDDETQDMLRYLNQMSSKGRETFVGMSSKAQEAISKFVALENETRTWGNTVDFTKSKLSLMGSNVDSLKGKVQVFGNSFISYVSPKVDSLASSIRSKLSNALSTVKSKIQSLGDAFSGLGGIMSSVFGGIGLAAMGQMTIGASINRERIQQLSYAMLGYGESFESFSEGIWDQMDTMTNSSLVSLDQLSQAASVVKMSTGASKEQMQNLLPVLNDIGQRAILMGKSGEEAMGLMQAAGKGLNGEFEMLRENFGITKDKLKEHGWSGAADDVDGYTKALNECLQESGEISGMMDTTHGKLTRLKKMWSVSARSLGDDFKPMVDQALDSVLKFVDANNDGQVDDGAQSWMKYAAGAMTAASAFATVAPSIAPALQVLESVWNSASWVKDKLSNLGDTINGMKDKWNSFKDHVQSAKDKLQEFKDKLSSSWNEGKLNTIKQKFQEIKDKIVDVKGKFTDFVGRLREIAADKIDTLNGKFSVLKDKLADVKGKLVDFLVRLKEIAAEKIATLATKFRSLADAISLAAIKEKLYAAAQWLVNAATAVWNALLAMNPVVLIVIAIIALIAVIYELGKAFGWWSNVQEMLQAVWEAIQNLWNAFINHPDVQGLIQWISDGWNWLCEAVGGVINAILEFFGVASGGDFDVIGAAVTVLTTAFDILTMPIRTIIGLIQLLAPYFQQFFNDVLVPLGEFLMAVFAPIWDVIVQVLTIVVTTVMNLITLFDQFKTGQIDLPNLLLGIWGLLSQMWIQIMVTIANAILNFAGQVWNYAVQAGSNFLNGVINYITQLPGRVWDFLVQTTQNILSAGAQWVDSARQKASEMVNGASTTVQELPGKIYNEFTKVPDRIREAIPQAIAAAINFGKDIINGVLNAMGIHSPGIVQESIAEEIKNTVQKIKDAITPAGEYASQLGDEIVEKFGSPQLDLKTEDLLPYTDLDADKFENVDLSGMSMDFSGMSSGLDESVGLTDETNTLIGESYAALAFMMSETLNSMVLNDQLAYGQIQSNDLATFQTITNGLNVNLLLMSNNLRTQLNNMLMTHRAAMANAANTTKQQLAVMLNETMRVTGEMRSAWAVMADSIISAAARIRNEATAYFDQLSSTIGSFYRKLQNPSQWAGGGSTGSPSTVRHTGRDPGVMTRITRGVANSLRRDNQLPYTISAVKATQSGIINPLTLEYMNISPSSKIDVVDLLQRGACPNCFAGGWEDVVPPNVEFIKKTAREWEMKGPAIQTGIGPIDTGMAFHVYDFENGTPEISWGSFVRIADAIAAAIPYDYYYNSDKYGSWQNALAHGAWNCYDGAHAMVALANTCGFGGSVFCGGSWGPDGHCWAEINGYTFDTTARKQRGSWTGGPCNYRLPAPSAGPAPINIKFPSSRSVPRTHTNPLEGLFNNDSNGSGSNEEIKLTLEHNVNVNVEGNTDEIDTNALIQELTASVTDKSLIDRIADALIKRDKRISRMGGA